MELTLTEENYLKAIYHLSNGGKKEVSTNTLAEELHTRPASVSDMIRKLNQKEVITYEKYQGVNISDAGKEEALKVIRKHRLWEVFLVSKLGFSWDEVHEVAEQLEHIKSTLLIRRPDEFLGHPRYDPHGDPIPDEKGRIFDHGQIPLTDLKERSVGKMIAVKNSSREFLNYMNKIKAHLGAKIEVLDILDFDQSVEISVDDGKPVLISREVAENILIKKEDLES